MIKYYFLILLFLIAGCAGRGIQYQDTISPLDISQTKNNNISTRVLAKTAQWRNSGVILKKGMIYDIKADGRWNVGPGWAYTGPDGIGCTHLLQGLAPAPLVPGYSWSTLMAKVGETGQPFAVCSKIEYKALKTGVLFFVMNDAPSAAGDNDGYVDVSISLSEKNDVIIYKDQTANVTNSIINHDIRKKNLGINKKTSWAVIIGISKYLYSGQNGLNNLIFADDDAKSFAHSLRNLGWNESHIKLLTNEEATQRNILIALKSWLTKAGLNDQVILFWAGHGYPDPEDPEKVYLATYDTDIRIPATGYRMDEVRKALEEIGSKNVILFADTCHAGKLITRGDGNRGISIVPNIKQQNTPKGWVFMVGADTDRQAVEDTSWANGAFTHSLIRGLNGEADGFQSAGANDGVVTMGELKDYMKTSMPDETLRVLGVAKHPVITTSTGDPDIWNLTLQVKE